MANLTTAATTDVFTSPEWTSANVTCVSRKKISFLLFSIVPSIPIIVNVVVLLAVALDSRRLIRQNRVYAHVSSTLIANVIFSLLALLQILSLYFNFEGYRDDPSPGRQAVVRHEMAEFWAFRKAFLYGMYIIMCGNIGFLIEAIRSGICVALRGAAGAVQIRSKRPRGKWNSSSFMSPRQFSAKTHDTAVPSSRVAKRRRSYISIALLWTLSLVYVVIPTTGWSCAHSCSCLSSCFPEDQIQNPPVRGCSRALPPMANSWLAVTIGVWAACLIGVFIVLRRSVVVLKRAMRKHSPEERDSVFCDTPDHIVTFKNGNSKESKKSETQEDVALTRTNVTTPLPSVEEGVTTSSLVTEKKEEVAQSGKSRSNGTKEKSPCNGKKSAKSRSRSTIGSASIFSGIFGAERRSLLSRGSQSKEDLGQIMNIDSSFRHVIWLTVLYACCTAPPMAYMVADMAFPWMKMNMILMNICLLFPFSYCLICPFLLIKCLPGVKASLHNLVLKTCTRTHVKRGNISRETHIP